MLRMITFKEAKDILLLDSISPYKNNLDIWKKQAIAYGATLNHPFNTSDWAQNRLLPVNAMKQKVKITWLRVDGTVVDTSIVDVGAVIQIPSDAASYASGVTNFDGWYTNPGDQKLVPGTTVAPSTNVVYKAKEQAIVYYTVTFLKSDGSTQYTQRTFEAGHRITDADIPSQGSLSDNYAATLVNPDPDLSYSPTGWGLSTDTDAKLGQQIKEVNENYTFVSTFNGNSRNDGNVKIFDQIGQLFNTAKQRPPSTTPQRKSGDISNYLEDNLNGWYSMVHDGHSSSGDNPDVLGADKGISPSETERLRVFPSASGRHGVDGFYSYAGDSIIYEGFDITQTAVADHAISGFKTSDSAVTSNDLLTEITFKDSNNNVTLHIKVNDDHKSWLRFAIIDVRGGYTNTKFVDMENYDASTYQEVDYPAQGANTLVVSGIPLQAEIQYYIKDNNGNARCGQIDVETPQGGDCSYVTDLPNTVFNSTNNKYMTKGTVFFYQLGPDYTGKPA